MTRALRTQATTLLGAATLLAAATFARTSAAQGFGQPGMGGMGGMNPPSMGQSPGRARPKPKQEGPETHAASGAEDTSGPPTQEAALPEDPTKIPAEVADRIGSDAETDVETGRASTTERDYYGLWYAERSGNYRFRTLFPLWAEREMPGDKASLVTPLYYRHRSAEADADVVFPLFWKLRNGEDRTTIVGPYLHREAPSIPASGDRKAIPGRHDDWLAPLYFHSSRDDGSGYLHVPPLLTFTSHTKNAGLNLVGPAYCSWKGGSTCDHRTSSSIDLGVAPLYFYGRDEHSEYEIIPPLLHVYRYSEIEDTSLNVWGPLVWGHTKEQDSFNIVPFYWHSRGKNETSTSVLPLFHYSEKGDASLLATPLFVTAHGENGESTFASWLYARHRGRTELDMWTPLYWQYRDPAIGLDRKLLFPFFYRNTSPRENDIAVFPFFGHFEKPGLRETTWVSPLFRYSSNASGWQANLFPFVSAGRSYDARHLVVAPFYWDFASAKSRTTVILPAFVRTEDETSVNQLLLNTFYREKKVRGGTDWEFHFFPVTSFGATPNGHFWNVLYGLAGYSREGTRSRMKALYIPFDLSE